LKEIGIVGDWLKFAGTGRILGFLEQQELPSGTMVAAKRKTREMAWCVSGSVELENLI